jgi:hypothetical protein
MHITARNALKTMPEEAQKSMFAEITQIDDMGTWTPVLWESLSAEDKRNIIASSMFLKEKFDPEGEFEKLKARLVAGGHLQDRSLYTDSDTSSPSVSLVSVFITSALAAREHRYVVTLDVAGAYLNAIMPRGSKPVLMRLDKLMTSLLLKKRPDYKKYVRSDGTMVVRLNKALYGCIESAKLWYNTISKFLISLGYSENPLDNCVFNKTVNGVQTTILLYVDDLKIMSVDNEEIHRVVQCLQREYKTVTVRTGNVHNYLGMTFDYSKRRSVKITMLGYIKDLLVLTGTVGEARTPATENLFEIKDSPPLSADKKQELHSYVMKLFYLAKRVRPDILTCVQFLSTRVQSPGPNEDDWGKLQRCLKYLNATQDLGLELRPGDDLFVESSIDASYGVHADAKSNTGVSIYLGSGSVYAQSRKQRINTKSSYEAEIVALSDGASQVLWSRDFLIAQGYTIGPAIVNQDNKSAILSVEKGMPSSRGRHFNIRYFWLKDRIDSGELKLRYQPTSDMVADMLTKPLQGQQFIELRNKLLNWVM